jgi:deoxyadenosine/deoxycytidine kinase
MRRWSFYVDLRFLAARAHSLSEVQPAGGVVVVDRCYLEGSVFVGLHASPHTLLARVLRRGRPFEQDMSLVYLQDPQRHYATWAANYKYAPVLRLDTDALNFRSEAEPVDRVVATLAPWLGQH